MKTDRRKFIKSGLMASTGLSISGLVAQNANIHGSDPANSIKKREDGFYSLEKGKRGWILKSPDNKPFFSLGFNHIDPVPIRRNENLHIWKENYDNSMEKWLKHVRKDLIRWSFNSVGWVQEVVVKGPSMHRHSRNFTFEEYQWMDMPYCHMLPFADFHQWEVETRHPDFFSKEFEEWCDYVARTYCTRMADDPKLIGYFYIDCPTWIHIMFENPVKSSIMDPEEYKKSEGKKRLFDIATRYYKLTHESIRRYDKKHLIFGDRYEANRPIPEEVIQAALPYVDILSFQHFNQPENIRDNLRKWHEKTGKPTLLADFGHNEKIPDSTYMKHNTEKYRITAELLRNEPSCVGLHLCGAYIANRARRRGILDEYENYSYPEFDEIIRTNKETLDWVAENR
jgi:hypothetical protein